MEPINKLEEKIKFKISISKIDDESNYITKKRIFINRKVGLVACVCMVLMTGVTFSKDIEKYFNHLFSNSTKAINEATENGYIQTENMNFVYNNNIGIKVDNLILDNLNLAISFCFEIHDENVKSISLKNFSITNDIGKKIYESELKYANSLDDIYLANSITYDNMSQQITDTIFKDSILLGLRQTENELNELEFEINSLNVTYYDDTSRELNGNWKFNVLINDKMKKSNNIKYILSEKNEYIENCTGILSATGMSIDLKLNVAFDAMEYVQKNIGQINDISFFYLKHNNEKLAPSQIELGNIYKTNYILRYDNIGIFSTNTNELELYLEPFDTTITLIRENN